MANFSGIFELAQHAVMQSARAITGSLDVTAGAALADLQAQLEAMGVACVAYILRGITVQILGARMVGDHRYGRSVC